MSDEIWRPGPRPEWVRSLHAATDPRWIRLEADELLDEATRRTRLANFGGTAFLEPYRIFVKALDEEAKLHPIGRILARGDVRSWLENRLLLTEARRCSPEIAREAVYAPLFITGLPRTGTSILHELLAQDPAHRAPLHWEVRRPCPAPEAASFESDPRIAAAAAAEAEVQLWNHVVPEYVAMHELGAQLPVECIQITAHEFRSDELMGRHVVPSYAAWLARADLAPAFAFHRRFLQHLQSRCRRERWVLKAPSHLGALSQLLAEYPDARVVVTYRDPLKLLPSVASILYSTAWVRSDAVDAQAVLGWFTPETCSRLLDSMSELRAAGTLPARQVCDVRYADLMARPFETLAAVYDHFGIPLRAEGFRYLLGLVRSGVAQALELSDPDQPRWVRNPDSQAKWGAENPDNQYLWARIGPHAACGIRGERRDLFDFLIEVKQGYLQLGDAGVYATCTSFDLTFDADGRFEILLAAQRPSDWRGDFLAIHEDARYVAIRQYLLDWEREAPARFEIARVGGEGLPPAPLTATAIADRIDRAGEWTLATASFWTQWVEQLREAWRPGQIAPARRYAGGAPDI